MNCFFKHKWSKWEFVETIKTNQGFSEDILERECSKCGKKDTYIGICDSDIVTGEKSPYTIKG